jgi:hypothetical protein
VPVLSVPPPIEQPPLWLTVTIGSEIGVGVNVGKNVGVAVGGTVQKSRPDVKSGKHSSVTPPPSQSVFFSHGCPGPSWALHVPLNPMMSQRLGSRQLSESQHTLLVQKPDEHMSGLPGSQVIPSAIFVGVGVGKRTQSPVSPQAWPLGQAWTVQHTPSVQKRSARHCTALEHASPGDFGVGVEVGVAGGGGWHVDGEPG